MAQRIFRVDDTDKWLDRFGDGSDGDLVISTNTAFSAAFATCTGTSGTKNLSLGSASGFANGDIVLIHQSQGTGAGNYELNKIVSGAGTTSIVLKYNLMNNYGTGAQMVSMKQHSSVTINSGVSWSAPSWNGGTGGIIAFLCNGEVTVNGTISGQGVGYRGAQNTSGTGKQGESTANGNFSQSTSNNANGGGGGGQGTDGGHVEGGHGGGGGHVNSGQSGNTRNTGVGGTGGASTGVASLITMVFGGAGGTAGSSNAGANNSLTAGAGGGIFLGISKVFTISSTGLIDFDGNSTGNDNSHACPGAGAGGSVRIVGQRVDVNTNKITVSGGTGGTTTGSFGGKAGDGSVGRIHVDYGATFNGSASPTIDTRKDGYLNDIGGSAMLMMME